jgi:hypothetical protein
MASSLTVKKRCRYLYLSNITITDAGHIIQADLIRMLCAELVFGLTIGGGEGLFIFTRKLTRKGLAVIVAVAGLLLCALIAFVSDLDNRATYGLADTEEDRIAFIKSYGWKVSDEPPEISEVTIPREFDAVYTRYNLIQKAQGLDLWDYSGCKVKRYTYKILNYPTGEEGVLINLLVYDGKIIGGDVMSPRIDGFMHGFRYLGD